MALFGRESQADTQRVERIKSWIEARSGLSLASMLLGIVAVVDAFTLVIGVAAGIGAIVTGVLGIRDLKSQPNRQGRRLCTTGIALGIAGIVIAVIMWTVVYPSLMD